MSTRPRHVKYDRFGSWVPRRIDYSDPKVMAERHASALSRRQRRGCYVLGHWVERGGELVLEAMKAHVVTRMPLVDEVSTQLAHMATWNTRQGAHQYVGRNALPLRVIHVPRYV